MKTPLSVIVVRQGPPADSEQFLLSLHKGFLGAESMDSYTAADYELLNPSDFRVFSSIDRKLDPAFEPLMPGIEKSAFVRESEATLVVLLISSPNTQEASQVVAAWAEFAKQQPSVLVLCFSLGSPNPMAIPPETPVDRFRAFGLNHLDERDLRRDFLALYSVHGALRLLADEAAPPRSASGVAGRASGQPTLFFSHAKRDGVPLATSLVSWIKRLKDFDFFYDTVNLDLSSNISSQLEKAIGTSVLVVLRTEVFDQRYWCQEEVFWAEKHGVPVIAVDARWNVKVAPSVVTLDSSPSVRIPDGSLVRILQAALEEALRVALHRARANLIATSAGITPESWLVLSRHPSLVALETAANTAAAKPSKSSNPLLVIYPNPALPDGLRDSAAFVCERLMPNSFLLSLDEFRSYVAERLP